jgi:hypothetical protein
MQRWPQFTIRYLLALVFWWALALGLIREIVDFSPRSSDERALVCFLVLPITLGPAYGGLLLKIRFGLFAGLILCGANIALLFYVFMGPEF